MITLHGSAADQTIARLIEVLDSDEHHCPDCGWPEGGVDHAEVTTWGHQGPVRLLCLRPRLGLR